MEIEPLQLSDLDELIAIEKRVFPNEAEDKEVYEDRIKTFPEGCFKIQEKEKLIAYMTTELWNEPHDTPLNRKASVFHDPKGKIIYLSNLSVAPEAQGTGLGRLLMEKLLDQAREKKCKSIYLRTGKKNRTFYEKFGFRFLRHVDKEGGDEVWELKL